GVQGGAGEVACSAEPHAVVPVAVERVPGALTLCRRASPLAEAWAAPRLPDLPAHRTEHLGDRLAAQPRVGLLDLAAGAPRSRKDPDLAIDLLHALPARRAQHQRRLQQIVVAAVGARSDHRLVEGDPLARDLLGGKRVARAGTLWAISAHVAEGHRCASSC